MHTPLVMQCCFFFFACRLLRSYKYKLEKDLTDKLSALGIDECCTSLTDKTPGIGFSPDSIQVQSK